MACIIRIPVPVLFLLAVSTASAFACAGENQAVSQQGRLPTGGGSAEAAACDMIRALVTRDYQRFMASTPMVRPASKTENNYVNHYVSLVTNTTFRGENAIVKAYDLLQDSHLQLKRVSASVVFKFPRYSSHGVLGTSTQHCFVDVTVAARNTGKEYTTRMLVVFREDVDQWKAFPIRHPSDRLYKTINEIGSGSSLVE